MTDKPRMRTTARREALRWLVVLIGVVCLWQLVVSASGAPPYILPPPGQVAVAWAAQSGRLIGHLGVTVAEIVLGLTIGVLLGASAALTIGYFRPARRWLLPVLVASQAIPVFALAPVLVLWLGYGMASKAAMATLIIFFPVTASFLDGLRRTEPGWVDLARTMTMRPTGGGGGDASMRGDRLSILLHVRLPAALPSLASGVRVATAVAPIGAVVGEWVGSSAGLGYLMLHANGRSQTALMFAAMVVLMTIALGLYILVDRLLVRLTPWAPHSLATPERKTP